MIAGAGTEPAPATRLRHLLLLLAALGVAGTAIELGFLRHWESFEQIIPWIMLAIVSVAIVSIVYRPVRARVLTARVVAIAIVCSSVYGMYEHVVANYNAGPLDQRFGASWETMSTASRWWEAATGGVGPSPLLAPAVLAQIGLCLLFATVAHPALRAVRARRADDVRPPRTPGRPSVCTADSRFSSRPSTTAPSTTPNCSPPT